MIRVAARRGSRGWLFIAFTLAGLGCAPAGLQAPPPGGVSASVQPAESEAPHNRPDSPEEHLERSRRAFAENDFPEAVRAAREAESGAKQAPAARWLESAALQAMGDLPGAEAAWRTAVATGPDEPAAWAAYAELAAGREAAQEALDVFAARLPQIPSDQGVLPALYGIAGWTALTAGQPGRAVGFLEFTRGTPEEARYTLALGVARLQSGDPDGAAALAVQDLEREPNAAVDAWLLLGAARVAQRLSGQARDAYATALERDPGNYPARIGLGVLYLNDGATEAALKLFQEAAEMHPGSPEAWHNLGLAKRFLGRWEEAREAYETVLHLVPGYAPTLKNMGILSEKFLGRPGAAVLYYDRYLDQVPDDEEVRGWRKAARRLASGSEG